MKKQIARANKKPGQAAVAMTVANSDSAVNPTAGWRRWSAAALLMCAVAGSPPVVLAAEPEGAAFNFVNVDLESVIKAVGHYIGVTFIIDPRVKGTLTLTSEKNVSKAQVLNMLTAALRLQGSAVVMGDGFAKVVPEGDGKLQASPTQVQPGNIALKGDQIASQIFRLNYESSTNLVTILRPLISPNNTINANPGNNTLVITDYADNLTRLGKIIAALDTPGTGDLDVIPVRYAIATDIAQMVNRLTESAGGVEGGRVSLLADPRTNSVILRAPSLARANLAKSLLAKLDQPTAQVGNVHVIYLKNADATKLAQTLRAVVSSDTSASSSSGSSTSSGGLSANPTAPGASGGATGGAPPSTPASQPLSSGGAAGFIQADASTNTLIITASEPVYRNLRSVIDLLDARRAQVYIESLIVEVTSERAAEFGIQWLGLSGGTDSNYRIGGALNSNSTGNIAALVTGGKAAAASAVGPGLSLGIFRQINGQLGLGALAQALESDGHTNILSTPNMVTLDNEEAKIIVGQNVPFISGSFSQAGTAGANPFQTIERKDVGLTLRVRPQVSEGGTIKLGIFQEMSSVDSTTNAAGIITNKRSIETNVLADDGQIIVLGGLIEDRTTNGVDQVPGLGDIPVLGNLFKHQTRRRTKTNLMVFLRPIVLRNADQSANLASDRYEFIRGAESKTHASPTALLPNLGAGSVVPLENGKLIGNSFIKSDTAPVAAEPKR
jgi:general secretion pathway protein D